MHYQCGGEGTSDSAEGREHETLGEQLADDSHSPRTERRPDREFAHAGLAAYQQQTADVHAGQQKHEKCCGKEHKNLPANIADDHVGEGLEYRLPVSSVGNDAQQHALHVADRVGRSPSHSEPCDEIETRLSGILLPLRCYQREGRPKVCTLGVFESLRKNSYDREGAASESKCLSKHAWIRRKLATPQPIADDYHVWAADYIVLGIQHSAKQRTDAKNSKEVAGDYAGAKCCGDVADLSGNRPGSIVIRSGEALKRVGVIEQLSESAIRKRKAGNVGGPVLRRHHHDTILIPDWQFAKEHRIHDREHRGGRSDADGERQHSDGGECGAFA